MRKQFRYAASALAVVTLVAAACTGDDDDSADTEATSAETEATSGETEATSGETDAPGTTGGAPATSGAPGTTTGDTVDVSQGEDLHFHVITHGDDGVFWSVVQNAVEQAAADYGVEVTYFGSTNDAEAQSQAIEAAIAEGSDGIAISLADPEGVSRRGPGRRRRRDPAVHAQLRPEQLAGPGCGHPRRPGRDRRRPGRRRALQRARRDDDPLRSSGADRTSRSRSGATVSPRRSRARSSPSSSGSTPTRPSRRTRSRRCCRPTPRSTRSWAPARTCRCGRSPPPSRPDVNWSSPGSTSRPTCSPRSATGRWRSPSTSSSTSRATCRSC